jgi:DNA-binding NtrC family response regulator
VRSIIDQVNSARAALKAATENVTAGGLRGSFSPPDPALHGKRILVADDEDIIRETVSDVLSRAGATVLPARDGNEAIEAARSQRFDLVLSDIKMPHHNGYEVFAAVRQASPTCPVILITGFGYDPNHSIVRASKEGLAGVLFKPFKVDQLLEEVRQALKAAAR